MSDAFDLLAEQLDELALAPARAAARAAPELAAVIAGQHAAGVAPDGAPWPLDKAGGVARLAELGAPVVTASGASLVVELPDAMRPHQAGTARLPQRKVIPEANEELPAAYEAPILETLAAEGLRR